MSDYSAKRESSKAPVNTSTDFRDEIAAVAKKQLQTSANYKQPRMTAILENEDIANFKLRPALQGRINIPFDSVVMVGHLDTLVAQVNQPPKIEFTDPTGANLKGARKTTAAFERDAKRMRLKMKDRVGKKLAALSGRAIYKYYAESDPRYCPYLINVDHLDFHCEPNGGSHLDDHYFTGQENIFRSKKDLFAGAKSGWYDRSQVIKLLANHSESDQKKNEDDFNNKNSRAMTLGLDMESHNYVGGALFNLVEWVTYFQGIQYHLIFEKNSGIWLRCVELKKDFSIDKTPFISWAAPQEDAFNFWNLGPADQIKPVAEAIRVNLNEILNNNRKRNWGMRAVDSEMFPDIKKLDWRQDGIVHAKLGMQQSISNGIYHFETPELNGALNLNAYLNNFTGEKLGISSQTQGDAKEDKVGIYQGNALQISKRMRLIGDSYEEMHYDFGLRYDWGLYDHADEEDMVRLISSDGVGWEKLTAEDKDPDYVIEVRSSASEMVETFEEKKLKLDALISIGRNKAEFAQINPKAYVEEKLRLVDFDSEKLKKLMNTTADITDELMSEAKKAIEQILEGKRPKVNYGATTAYLQYISDWILDNSDDLTDETKKKLEAYFDRHLPIAMKNAEQKQFNDELLAGGQKQEMTMMPTGLKAPTGEAEEEIEQPETIPA